MAFPDKATKTSKTNLFTLPRELRDIIYEYACDDVEINISGTPKRAKKRKLKISNGKAYEDPRMESHGSHHTSILATCKQIREEAHKIYYQRTAFYFRDWLSCALWLKRCVPPTMHSAIRTLRVECPEYIHVLWLLQERKIVGSGGLRGLANRLRVIEAIKLKARREAAAIRREVGEDISSRLKLESLQVQLVDSECKVVWTSKADEIEPPTVETLRMFLQF